VHAAVCPNRKGRRAHGVSAIWHATEALARYLPSLYRAISLYFVVSGTLGWFHLLKYGLASVLIFVGTKMARFRAIPTSSLRPHAGSEPLASPNHVRKSIDGQVPVRGTENKGAD